jgi:hypothetical protein
MLWPTWHDMKERTCVRRRDPSVGKKSIRRSDDGWRSQQASISRWKLGGMYESRGRCYDHNFLRFSPIFDEKKLAFFSKTNVMVIFFQNLALFWVKNANIFAKFFGENILKIITSVPGWPDWANFRLLGNCLLWAVILKIIEVGQNLSHFFPQEQLYINFDKRSAGLDFGWFFHKIIWSTWLYRRPLL